MRSLLFLSSLVLATSLSLSYVVGAQRGLYEAGWQPIKNVSNPHVQEIAKFAVDEYNKNSHIPLKLFKVVSGETRIVAGIEYRLIVAVTVGSAIGIFAEYEAIVWEKSGGKLELTSFKWIRV